MRAVLLIAPLLAVATLSAGEPPKIEQVGLVAPDTLGISKAVTDKTEDA